MTDKQKAYEIQTNDVCCVWNGGCPNVYHAAMEMAKWKEQQMIGKACEWLKENIKDYLSCDGYSDAPGFKQYVSEDFYEDFKKAMEGGEE